MDNYRRVKACSHLWYWLIWIIAAAAGVIFLYSPFAGDDWAYRQMFEGPAAAYDSWLSYPRWCASHWASTNGRLANYLMPLLGVLPAAVRALLCAGALWIMYYTAVRMSRARGEFIPILLIATMAWGLAWWDSMYIFDCQLNYIWSTAAVLLALTYMTGHDGRLWFASLLCILAGMMHETASLSIVAGWIIWQFCGGRRPTRRQGLLLLCFAAGTALAVCSPGILARSVTESVRDDSLPLLLLKSDAAPALLWLITGIMACRATWRRSVAEMFHSPLGWLALASLVSTGISLASGIVGRSGWFGSVYAMIAAAGWLAMHWRRQWIAAALLLAIAVAAQQICVAIVQYELAPYQREFEQAYLESDDGIVYLDCPKDDELPWWTLGRLRSVPDADDAYLNAVFAGFYGRKDCQPVVLPSDARKYVPLPGGNVILSDGSRLVENLDDLDVITIQNFEKLTLTIINMDGELWVAQPVPGGFFLTPRVADPGDRL